MTPLSIYARLLFVLIVAQFYAAGLAIFGAASFVPHAVMGWVFILLALLLTIASLVSRSRRRLAPLAIAVLVLSAAQPAIVFGLRRWPAAAALHPVVGLAIAGLLIAVARRANEPQS